MSNDFELKFDPKTIEHLGVKMYSTLPPALSELISNAYDADASSIEVNFFEQGGKPKSIKVIDNGHGMSSGDIQDKFLVIGRNRRLSDGDKPSKRFKRLPTGKKGLGKLALFGLAKLITVDTVKGGLRNRFVLDWEKLLDADGVYNPITDLVDKPTNAPDGTVIRLSKLKRKAPFDLNGLADSLSRIFIVDRDFDIYLKDSEGNKVEVSNDRRYSNINKEFQWDVDDFVDGDSKYKGELKGSLVTSETPIPPSSGLRGITIFSRGKLVNLPEFFSNSTSSHFFQYLTGWVSADFIDLIDEDVISTNRQYINWDQAEMQEFREFLAALVSKVNASWRAKRKEKKERRFKDRTGIDRQKWLDSLPSNVKKPVKDIVDTLGDDESVSQNYSPIVEALHEIVPEYPLLHWRHLHDKVRNRVEVYYKNKQYAQAADQATKIYAEVVRELTGQSVDGTDVAKVFGGTSPQVLVADINTASGENIQQGQQHMTRGVMQGFRNPVNHSPIDSIVPSVFTELDCLNILSLVSYLVTRLDNSSLSEPSG